MSLRELITVDNESVAVSEKVSFDINYYNFDIVVSEKVQKIEGAKGRAISAVLLNDGDAWIKVRLYYSHLTGSIGNVDSQDIILAPYQYLVLENFPLQKIEVVLSNEIQQSPYASSVLIVRGLEHPLFKSFGKVTTDYKIKLIAFDLVRGQINVNGNSSQNITVGYITPLKGKLKLLIFPSASVTASLSFTDMITQQTFTVNVNSGNSVYGEYEMDVSKLMQINSITLTNNNSSSVTGYLILLYEVG
jgi:hypothetical protein